MNWDTLKPKGDLNWLLLIMGLKSVNSVNGLTHVCPIGGGTKVACNYIEHVNIRSLMNEAQNELQYSSNKPDGY